MKLTRFKHYTSAIKDNNLGLYRKHIGLRQRDLATLANFKANDRICHWEKGRALPSIVNLFRLSAAFGVLPHQLYEELYLKIEKEVQAQREKLARGETDPNS